MTFITKTLEVGRQAVNILELDLDRCSRSYGVSPCTASLAFQNLSYESETFSDPTWIQGGNIIGVDNQIANPLTGAITAAKIESNFAGSTERIIKQLTDGNTLPFFVIHSYTLSCYVNADEVEHVGIGYAEASTIEVVEAKYNIREGVLVDITDFSGNYNVKAGLHGVPGQPGWFRIWINFTPPLPVPGSEAYFLHMYADDTFSTSDSIPIGEGFYAYGFQNRANAFDDVPNQITTIPNPGKYIATTTTVVDNAGGMPEVNAYCFNTFDTCQDTPNYLNAPQTYKFIDRVDRDIGIIDAVPAIKSISYGPTKLEPGGGLAFRGSVSIQLQDFTTDGLDIDDYTAFRDYDPLLQGSFFGKLKRRNRFYIGRPMRVLEGYQDAPFDSANFRTREYIIESISGPDKTGRVTIVGKDPLSLAKNDRSKCPTASVGVSTGALTTVSGVVNVTLGTGPDYDADDHIRIDDEIMFIVSRATDALTVTRAQGGTTAETHDAGAAVQSCKTYVDEPIIDIIQELLEDFANIPSSFIPFADWQTEEAASLVGYDLTTIISEPTGVQKLLKEIVEISLLDIWYSDVDQEIKLKLQTPFTDVTVMLDDDKNILENSLQAKDVNARRLTRVLIYYGIRNFARDLTETENYSLVNFEIEADKEGVNKYNDEKIKTLFSRWMDSSNETQIQLTSQRLLDRFSLMPVELTFDLDAKDVPTLETGDVYDINTRIIQGPTGLPETTRFQVIETKPLKPASRYRYKSLAFFSDPNPDTITISTNQTDFDLFLELGGPPGPVDVTVTIDAAVEIKATNGNPAFKTDGMHPDSTVTMINNGFIYGFGGNGGNGGSGTIVGVDIKDQGIDCIWYSSAFNGSGGQNGGDAINCTVSAIEIDNTNGEIFAGAGGGGGGDADSVSLSINDLAGGSGGGGGIGTDTGNAGAGGNAVENESDFGCGADTINGLPGAAGSEVSNGAGGVSQMIGFADGGTGGDGGSDWGNDGGDGGFGGGGQGTGQPGGAGGFAVRLNGAVIVWTGGNDPSQVKGDVA